MKKLIFIIVLLNSICQGMNVSYTLNSMNQQGVTILKHNVDINAPFQITSSNVVLDMNGKTIRGGILISPGLHNITIKNGIVDPITTTTQAAIHAKAGCENIQLIDLKIRGAQRGIFFETVTDSLIQNCELTGTTSAVVLTGCANVVVDSVLAQNNLSAGFAMLTSSTCLLRDCQAINTGLGNTQVLNNTVVGFVSNNGMGNIFERCIANATQAISTTDYNSVVAGFVLRGTERFTKIIECEASSAAVASTGVTVPYGILLERTINPSLLTTTTAFVASDVHFTTVSWSPDGALFAGGELGNLNKHLYIFQFDRPKATTIQLTSLAGFSFISSVDWAPMNDYIALAATGNQDVFIIHYERMNNTLEIVTRADVKPTSPVALEWSLDGRYIAVADDSTNIIRIYKFDSVAQTLTQVATSGTLGNPVSVAWSPDGKFVAVADEGNNLVLVFEFQSATNTLTQRASSSALIDPVAIDWSPDGTFIAVTDKGVGTGLLYIYRFNTTTYSFNVMATSASAVRSPRDPQSVVWSPDSAYIAIPENPTGMFTSSTILIYKFDRGSNMLIFTIEVINDVPDGPKEADWSPDGQNILLADTQDPNKGIFVYEAWTYPPDNVVKNCITYCNSGGRYAQGVGISGSSIANMIIQNTAYANSLLSLNSSSQLVPTNYQFVPNVFNQLFGQGPTELQNIALAFNQPVVMPEDLALILEQAQFEITHLDGQLNVISGKVGSLQSAIDAMQTCSSIVVSASSTTLTQSGLYCLSDSIVGSITITGVNIVLDLNNHRISQGILINSGSNNITVRNGAVENTLGGVGIFALSSSNIFLNDLTVNNAATSIIFSSIDTGAIQDCKVYGSLSGIALDTCRKIIIENSIAQNIQQKGFSLIDSTTCCVIDCQSLSVGSNNLLQSVASPVNGIIGFDARGGYGNIFERCIANSTQGLTVTGFSSIVAGFRLGPNTNGRQEQASKIIDCESANATTSPNGVTVPYGILLEAQVSGLTSVTAIDPGGEFNSDYFFTVDWSPDGKYLSLGGQTNIGSSSDTFLIYAFDYATQSLTQLISTDALGNGTDYVISAKWSPDGNYIALAGQLNPFRTTNDFIVFRFDPTNQTFTKVAGFNIGTSSTDAFSVSWSPDGNYIAVGGSNLESSNNFQLYGFNQTTQVLTLLQLTNPGLGGNVQTVSWSSDGNYVAIGGVTASSISLIIYLFDRATQTLSSVTTQDPAGPGFFIRAVAWSPNAKYLAVVGNFSSSSNLVIYRFNRATQTLQQLATYPVSGDVRSVDWSPDGQYVAIGANFGVNNLRMYRFDPGLPVITQVAAANPTTTGPIFGAWSPDGQFIAAAAGDYSPVPLTFFIFQALTFPSRNVITNNTVYCNSGGVGAIGIGISGSSIANMILQNSAYSNPIYPQASARTQIEAPTNYAFVCNALDSQAGLDLSLVQNAAINSFQPFPMPDNVALLLKQDIAQVAALGACEGTAITFIGGTVLTLSTSGNYCLAANLTGDIVISTTGVTLNLNDHCLTGAVSVQTAQNVVIQNGVIEVLSNAGLAPLGALDIANSGVNIVVRDAQITSRDATTTSNSGRPGITTSGVNVIIQNCIINTGNGLAAAGQVANGGAGIVVGASSARTIIRDCIIATGNGATGTTPGSGGNGIHVLNGASGVEIFNCLVQKTGSGGNDTDTAAGGGNGGNGIQIDSSAIDTAVMNCTIRNTGAAGSGTSTSNAAAGKAVNDRVTIAANVSQIFSNFAHNIASATKFDIQAGNVERGILTPNPPTAVPINPFANVFT